MMGRQCSLSLFMLLSASCIVVVDGCRHGSCPAGQFCNAEEDCVNKGDLRLACYQSQVVLNSGSCAGTYTVRVCAETQDQADSKVQKEVEPNWFDVPDLDECKRKQFDDCNSLGGTTKSSDCQSTCLKLLEKELGLFCNEDSTCHIPEDLNDAYTRRCCVTLNQYKDNAKKMCRNMDETVLASIGGFVLAFVNTGGGDPCQQTNCVSPYHDPEDDVVDMNECQDRSKNSCHVIFSFCFWPAAKCAISETMCPGTDACDMHQHGRELHLRLQCPQL
eukprot:1622468-Rhodomonas_salina.1